MNTNNNELLDDSNLDDLNSNEFSLQTLKQFENVGYWARLYAIAGLSGTALLIIIGILIGTIILSGALLQGLILAIFCAGLIFMIFTGWIQTKMLKYGNGLREFAQTRNFETLETAFRNRKTFWLVGVILSIGGIVFGTTVIILVVMAAVAR